MLSTPAPRSEPVVAVNTHAESLALHACAWAPAQTPGLSAQSTRDARAGRPAPAGWDAAGRSWERVDLTGARCAGGGVGGGGVARGRHGHGKQRKCRECCEERADRSPGQEQQHDAATYTNDPKVMSSAPLAGNSWAGPPPRALPARPRWRRFATAWLRSSATNF